MALALYDHPAGHTPPHPAIEPRVLRLIERAIVAAWELVRTSPPPGFDLATAPEDTVTAALYTALVNRVLVGRVVRGFTPDLFRVSREPKVWTHDARSLDKMPDLFFHLISDRAVAFPDQDGLFVECKPVDAGHPAGSHYCDRGLRRFVSGEYGWAMREGLMVGYSVTGYTLPGKLTEALAAGTRPADMPLVSGPTPVPRTCAGTMCQRPHATVHGRRFSYRSGATAPDIAINHLWLTRD